MVNARAKASKNIVALDELDKQLLNLLQKGLPVCEQPFLAVAQRLNSTEALVLAKLENMLENGVLTRFGPMFDAACFGGAFTLAAMAVPAERFAQVTEIVNSFAQVAHNYQRSHQLNMWFVIGTETQAEISQVINSIEQQTGLEVVNVPKEHEFFVGLYLPV
jgi:siroheme decarboxylase